MAELCWGIDLGGTKMEGVVLASAEEPEPLCRIRVPTEAEGGYQHVLSRIRHLVERLQAEVKAAPVRIGFGTPGILDPTSQTLKNSSTLCYKGQPLKKDLERLLGVPVVLANDANCFALAEARLGAGRGAETVFGIIMGTGVGGGVVVDGRALYGCQGIAGEWGHNVLDESGPECYCGRRGCVETFLCGPALERYYQERSGQARPLREIALRHGRGSDPYAEATIERLLAYFGRALAVVINLLDPHVVVLGGGVSNVDLLYTAGVEETARHVFNDRLETRVVRNALGDSAGVFGAAMLVA
ncbi:MAG: ROK family protein [Candidatus Latescibacterota bacterium]|jgi:predicted NBD/HSP70 family sugar kinase